MQAYRRPTPASDREGGKVPVHVQLIYAADCPHWRLARDRLVEAVRIAGVGPVAIELVEMSHTHHDVAPSEHGSPTVLIDGTDPFPLAARGSASHCRVYTTAEGFEGAPAVRQLVDALRDAGPWVDPYDAVDAASFPASDPPETGAPGLA